ncbi:unnamed protein product [Durusdinium trenchii]|uniref:Helicase C-terminal domain-containing protein n=1 Tax=Durusdinium trenchii TaxID=1381693 RepID=A0ABP0Q0V7_9DINO
MVIDQQSIRQFCANDDYQAKPDQRSADHSWGRQAPVSASGFEGVWLDCTDGQTNPVPTTISHVFVDARPPHRVMREFKPGDPVITKGGRKGIAEFQVGSRWRVQFEDGELVQRKMLKKGRLHHTSLRTDGSKEHKLDLLREILESRDFEEAVIIVFCRRRDTVMEVFKYLKEHFLGVVTCHGGMTQSFRSKSIKALKEGKAEILVATDIAARGLDIPEITHVVNFELPLVLDEFVHRCGRTGRIGKQGTTVTLVTGREKIFAAGRTTWKVCLLINLPLCNCGGIHGTPVEKYPLPVDAAHGDQSGPRASGVDEPTGVGRVGRQLDQTMTDQEEESVDLCQASHNIWHQFAVPLAQGVVLPAARNFGCGKLALNKEPEGRKIVTVKDVEPEKFISAFSQHLKRQGRFELPKWADVVKTSKARELPPSDPDWLYVRTASMVRKIYIRKGMGVGAFRKVYGSQQRRGTCTNVFTKSSGKIARYILQQLEEMGLVEQDEEGGRMITKEGQRELDTVAVQAAAEEDVAPDVRSAYIIKNRDMQRRTKANLMNRMAELEGTRLSSRELNRGTFSLMNVDDEEFDQNQGRGGNYQVFRGDSLEALEAWDESEMDDVEDANENFQEEYSNQEREIQNAQSLK